MASFLITQLLYKYLAYISCSVGFQNQFTYTYTYTYSCTYVSPRHKAHKALAISIHPLWFTARAMTVARDHHPAAHLSSSTIHFMLFWVNLVFPSLLDSSPMLLVPHYMSNPVSHSMSDVITCKISLLQEKFWEKKTVKLWLCVFLITNLWLVRGNPFLQ